MNKQTLRTALTGLSPDDRLTITFLGDRASDSGEYSVVRTRTGRGKGGSLLVELTAPDRDTLTTGTPDSDSILHVVTSDGTMYGHETEADVPPVFETDAGQAEVLKRVMKSIVDGCTPVPKEYPRDTRSRYVPTDEVSVTVESSYEPFAGTFAVKQVQLMRGRYGKVMLTVVGSDGVPFELDSFNHSGVVTSLTVS